MSDLQITEKTCRICGVRGPISEFYPHPSTRDGYRHDCKRCVIARSSARQRRLKGDPAWRREQTARLRRWRETNPEAARAQRERGVERNRQYIVGIKSRPCADCGKTFPKPVMEFDHVRGEKVGIIAQMVARAVSLERLKAEIAKCDLVCANCHRIRHWASPNVVALREDRNRDA